MLELFGKLKWRPTLITILIVLGTGMTIFCLASIGRRTMTPVESNLLALFLTISSGFVSWLMTRIYSSEGVNKAMRDRDVQRANAIGSIRRQLTSLVTWNTHKGDARGNDNNVAAFSDHIHESLCAIDCQLSTMLMEIGGNIGDSDRQASALLKSIQSAEQALGTLASVRQSLVSVSEEATSQPLFDRVQAKIAELDEQFTVLASQISTSAKSVIEPAALAPVTGAISCPYCETSSSATIPSGTGITVASTCGSCNKPFNIHSNGRNVLFTRPIAYSELGEPTPGQLIVRDSLSPPGFDFDKEEFLLLSDVLLSTYRPHEFTLSSLVDEMYDQGVAAVFTKTRVRRFLQLLYWGRLFQYPHEPADTLPFFINSIDRLKVAKAFAKSVGFRMARLSTNIDTAVVEREIKLFLDSTSDVNLEGVVASYFAGRHQALQPTGLST